MTIRRKAVWVTAGALGAAALGGIAHMAHTWYAYGRPADDGHADALLDRFMPSYEVRERHQVVVAAPVADTYAAARSLDIRRSRVVRAIFRGRELLMGSDGGQARGSQPLVDETLALGWGVLGEVDGRELAMGAVTRPWEPDVRFRRLPPEAFARFDAPGNAKIVWNLSAAPLDGEHSVFSTETRVATTDGRSRAQFRRYWTVMSPGIILIRRLSLGLVRSEAERRYRERRGRERLTTVVPGA
jgi:hypothetical protein